MESKGIITIALPLSIVAAILLAYIPMAFGEVQNFECETGTVLADHVDGMTTIQMYYNGVQVANYVIEDPQMSVYNYFVEQALQQCETI